MLAGIYDPRSNGNPDRLAARIESAFPAGSGRTRVAGALAVITDQPPRNGPSPPCALEGSIYNLPEVAEELGVGADADAEAVIALGFQRWGEEILNKLRGAFALVVWGGADKRIVIAQDQVGVNTFFTFRDGERLYFASEIRDLLTLLPSTPGPDATSVVRRIAAEFAHERRTMYEGVNRLGAGYAITAVDGRLQERQYWTPVYQPPLEGSRLEIAAQFRDALIASVGMRLRGANGVGIMLSGGFDSSAVLAAASAHRGVDSPAVSGYSAVFPSDPRMDDRDLLDVLVGAIPIHNVRYSVRPGGAFPLAVEYLRDWKLPLSGPGWTVERALTKRAAAEGIDVMLDGQGGDEVFGMSPYLLADRLRSGRIASAVDIARYRIPGSGAGAPWRGVVRCLQWYGLQGAAPRLYSFLRDVRGRHRRVPRILGAQGAEEFMKTSGELTWAQHSPEPRSWLHMRKLLIHDREAGGLGDYVRQRAGWAGIEARPPLFDVELIETALRLPPEFALDPYLDRPLGREAVAGLLPDGVRLSRRKSNLGPFFMRGLAGPDLPIARKVLGDGNLEIGRWVDTDLLTDFLEHPPAVGDASMQEWIMAIWGVMTTECWLRSLSDHSFADRLLADPSLVDPGYEEVT